MAFVVAFVLLVAMGIGYTRHVQAETQRQWCELLTLLTAGPAPETERGRAVLEAMRRLEADFGC